MKRVQNPTYPQGFLFFFISSSFSGGAKSLSDMDKMDLKLRLAGLRLRLAGLRLRLAGLKLRLAGVAYLLRANVFFTVAICPRSQPLMP
jgi:hypothetical protein